MPELPEVETVVQTLRPLITDKEFAGVRIYWPRTVDPHAPDELAQALLHRTVVDVFRRAKLIVLHLDDEHRLTAHLRMTGELLYQQHPPSNFSDRPYLRASFEFEDGSHLLFDDVRKFGRIRLYDQAGWKQLDEELGIEPLSPSFTPAALHAILRSHRRQLKPLLLDQTIIAGLGNIYVDESLFRARLHPLQPSNRIGIGKATDLHAAIVNVLVGAIENRGTTLQNYRSGLGEPGNNRGKLLVYGSAPGTPCPRCGRALERLVVGQRGTIFCPRCQRRY